MTILPTQSKERHKHAIVFIVLAVAVVTSCTTDPPTPPTLTQSERDTLIEYALSLINKARSAEGLNELTLDDNPAAQSHAEDMRVNCTRSHWGVDGMKAYMRYTLAGGEQYSAENIFAIDFCPDDLDNYALETPTEQIDFAMGRFLNSPGHRRNILNPHHRKVGIGLTYRTPTIWFVQLFVGDYIEYDTEPNIEQGILTLSGSVKNGASIEDDGSLDVDIYFDPPVQHLTRGQLARTYCYGNGTLVAELRAPSPSEELKTWITPGSDRLDTVRATAIDHARCPNPYDIDRDLPAPTSSEQAHQLWEQARDASQSIESRIVGYSLITAETWSIDGDDFQVSADISEILNQHGNGVYTIVLWGEIDGERTPISEYSMFIPPRP